MASPGAKWPNKPWSWTFDPDIAAEIIERIASGDSVRSICSTPGLPPKSVIYRWLANVPEFAKEWNWAHTALGLAKGDNVAAIANMAMQELEKPKVPSDEPGAEDAGFDAKTAEVALKASTWLAERLVPKVYNLKTVVELGGVNGSPLQITFNNDDANLC